MVLKKVGRKVSKIVTRPFRKPQRPYIAPAPPETVAPPPPPIMEAPPQKRSPASPFLFPPVESQILPDPSRFFSPDLCASALPTNSFFQNFVLKNGDQPEYVHPYLIKLAASSLSVSYPSRFANSSFIYQVFNADFTISASQNAYSDLQSSHVISSYSDLSVTVDLPSSNLRFFLVRGSPFLTCAVSRGSCLTVSTIHAILSFSSNSSLTKYTVTLNNNQTWFIYSSSPIQLTHELSAIHSSPYSGVIRFAVLPESDQQYEAVLDRFSPCYPVSGGAVFTGPYSLEYRWERKGWGDLLMLAHPLHLQLLSNDDGQVAVLNDFKYKTIDGELVGVVGDSWSLKSEPIAVTWHSIRGVREESCPEVVSALCKDVEALDSSTISTSSSYFYGKLIARAARLALIAEEVRYPDVIPVVGKFLKEAIEPWLNGNFSGNGFLYEGKWGGIVTKQGAADPGADFGFGLYNDHHYHLGYFLYAIAVLAKIDPAWGRKYRPQAYSLMADFMSLGRRANSSYTYTRLRCFDLYKLHSWAGGLTEFGDGRNQESTSEAINAYYSAALMGMAYGDSHLVTMGSTLTALEIQAARTWWHVKEGNNMYEQDFSAQNKMVGVLWANKRDSGLWFAPPDWRECRLGIQVLPLLPITEAVFSDMGFVRDLVNWTMPALGRKEVGEGWKGFVYALEGTYDRESASGKIRSLQGVDDGNSFSNLLWWIHSRGDDDEDSRGEWGRHCWFGHYCH